MLLVEAVAGAAAVASTRLLRSSASTVGDRVPPGPFPEEPSAEESAAESPAPLESAPLESAPSEAAHSEAAPLEPLPSLDRPVETPRENGLDPEVEQAIDLRFHIEADRVQTLHARQTREMVVALKAKYEYSVFGPVRVWDLVEKLARCVDCTDTRLFCASQWLHVQQTLATMEQDGVDDPDMHLIAILHDLGKVFLLSGEVPENVVCGSNRIGEYAPGAGLEQMIFQFGHGELIYSRVRGHVPDHVAWALRYHSLDLHENLVYMSPHERELFDKYVVAFRRFDLYSKSPKWVPTLDMTKYRELIEAYFPQPILF